MIVVKTTDGKTHNFKDAESAGLESRNLVLRSKVDGKGKTATSKVVAIFHENNWAHVTMS